MGTHYIRTKLYSIPLSILNEMYKQSIEAHIPNVYSAEQRLHYIIQDIAFHRLFKPAKINCAVENKRSFMNIHFDNKGLDADDVMNEVNNTLKCGLTSATRTIVIDVLNETFPRTEGRFLRHSSNKNLLICQIGLIYWKI